MDEHPSCGQNTVLRAEHPVGFHGKNGQNTPVFSVPGGPPGPPTLLLLPATGEVRAYQLILFNSDFVRTGERSCNHRITTLGGSTD